MQLACRRGATPCAERNEWHQRHAGTQHTHEQRSGRTGRRRRGAPPAGGLRPSVAAARRSQLPDADSDAEREKSRTETVTPPSFVVNTATLRTTRDVGDPERPGVWKEEGGDGRGLLQTGGLIKVNGCPIELLEQLALKTFEPVLLLGQTRFANVDIRIRVKGGGFTAQIYAIRQAIAKSLVAYYQKYVDEASKTEIRDILRQYDRTLLVADPRRCESKKFGGPSARARYQKSYR